MAALYMVNNDIAIAADGSQRWASFAEETAQRLRAKYKLFLGEWFLDLRKGVPYYRDVLKRAPNMSGVRSTLMKVATDDPAVEGLTRFELVLDAATRRLTVSLTATLITGESLGLTV
jgi:hypothetical protein